MTALLGKFGAVLGEVVLRSIVVVALVATAVLAAKALTAGTSFVLGSLGR